MHLIIGSSYDATADLISEELRDSVIRLNNDRPHDLGIEVNSMGFTIQDLFGRKVHSDSLCTVILRKMSIPDSNFEGEQLYAIREYTRALEGLLDWIERYRPEAMPMSHRSMSKATKFVCSRLAQDYFDVPEWLFTTIPSASILRRPVVKNLCGLPIENAGPNGDGKLLYVQEVNASELADNWPWYLQELAQCRYDLTVAYMGGHCHALRLDRNKFQGLDWRRYIGTQNDNQWELVQLPNELKAKISSYMADLDLTYGRLDFLYTAENFSDVKFLEVNPHGQWAWMDLNKDRGIFDAMMKFLTTPRTIVI
jgi:hypothetical protein